MGGAATIHDSSNPPRENRLDYNLSHDEIAAFEKVVVFKRHLKMATKLIIEDIHRNFEAYKVVPTTTQVTQTLPHCKIVLARNSEEGGSEKLKKVVAFREGPESSDKKGK